MHLGAGTVQASSARNEQFQNRFPEHQYKYFLISTDLLTWKKLDGTIEVNVEEYTHNAVFGSPDVRILSRDKATGLEATEGNS
jgi:hypothetical protein